MKKILLCFVTALALVVAPGGHTQQSNANAGLVGEYFEGLNNLPESKPDAKPVMVRVDKQVNFSEVGGDFYGSKLSDNFAVRWTGVLRAPKDGSYGFSTESDDGSRLWIDGKLIVDNGGPHAFERKDGKAELTAGDHEIKIEFFDSGGGAGCIARWKPPGGGEQPIPTTALFYKPGAENIAWDKVAWEKRPKGKSAAAPKGRWTEMDYGPFLSASFVCDPSGNFNNDNGHWTADAVPRGIAVRLAKDWNVGVVYDTDTMRLAAGWAGAPLNLSGVIFEGAHGPSPKLGAEPLFRSLAGPGWAHPSSGSFDDPRPDSIAPLPRPGPLPREWTKYRGLYVNGDKVILSYTVGDCSVLEMPSTEMQGESAVVTRAFTIGPSSKPLSLMICEGNNLSVSIKDAPNGHQIKSDNSRYTLSLPPLKSKSSFYIRIASAEAGKIAVVSKPEDLTAYTKGGAARWTETVTTKGTLGTGTGAYVVDTLTAPEKNPWNAWIRFGGLDFFSDGRAALSTWSGDVWIVSGIDDNLENLTWKRFATGLHQPLGLKIVNDVIYTVGHDQITRLHDLNKDGEADFYENFNNDWELTTAFHAFCFDLHTDPQGNFYFAFGSPVRSGGGGFHKITAHHGTMMRVSKDGSKLDVVATGFRAPNGMGVGPKGELTTGDNQGTWTPSCPINLVKPGGFYGNVDAAHHSTKPTKRDPPICWMPMSADNSGGGQVWVPNDKWGLPKGQLLHTSYGKASLYSVMFEEINGVPQGGVVKFPVNFASGTMRPRFNTKDGQLYIAGLKGWQTDGAKDGALQRVRYTGKTVNLPIGLRVTKTGVDITFTNALDPESANDAQNFSGQRWNVKWTQSYGSPEFSVADPNKQGHDPLNITAAKLAADGKTISLTVEDLKPVTNQSIKYKIKAADGSALSQEIFHTINVLPQ